MQETRLSGIRRIKPEVESAIVAEYAAHTSAAKLAAKYGINRKTVTMVVRRNGGQVLDQRSASGRPMIDASAFLPVVKRLKEAGCGYNEISKEIGFGKDVVGRLLKQLGLTQRKPQLRAEGHGGWKGGVVKTGGGYIAVIIPKDWAWPEMTGTSGYILQHRYVMALHLGRPLLKTETVHHINGDKTDNRIENLQLRKGKHGRGEVCVCADCGSYNIVHKGLAS